MSAKNKSKKGSGQAVQAPTGSVDIANEFLISKDPVVALPTSQLAVAPEPILRRGEVCECVLDSKDELKLIQDVCELSDRARNFIPFLYSYRSITKALNSDMLSKEQKLIENAHNKGGEFKTKVADLFLQVFAKPFNQIKELMAFLNEAPAQVERFIARAGGKSSDVFYRKLTTLLDLMYNIDHLKIVKTGIVEDLRFFKGHPTNVTQAELFSSIMLNLPVPQKMLTDLREKMESGAKARNNKDLYVPVLSGYLEYLVKVYTGGYSEHVVMPSDRQAIVTSLVSVVWIHCGDSSRLTNLARHSAMSSAMQILIENPIVPLYGENSLAPGFVLSKVKGFNCDKLATSAKDIKEKESQYSIRNRLTELRRRYRDASSALSHMAPPNGKVSSGNLQQVFGAISDLAFAIKAQFSFKIFDLAKGGPGIKTYDRGVRLNYTKEDLDALIELIGYLKTLACSAMTYEETVCKTVTKLINHEIQEFVHNVLEDPLAKALEGDKKKKKGDQTSAIVAVRSAFGKWGSVDPSKATARKSKDAKPPEIAPLSAMVSTHQVDVLRTEAFNFVRSDGPLAKLMGKGKSAKFVSQFIDESYKWYLMMNYTSVIRQESNLSSLWFREVYLEMDKLIQFPVRSSLPFILAEHLLTIRDRPELHDSMLFPFEIYNDAAYSALNTFKSQYLFKEIEAELALCIEMIAFSFSETIYRCRREAAAAMELPTELAGVFVPGLNRYNIVIRQNNLQLLGAPVDFNRAATDKLNEKMRKELESYIEMLTDLRLLPYVAHLVRVAQTTHILLLEDNLRLDSFSMIWQKAKGFTNPISLESRLANATLRALDFAHWVYNTESRRFIVTRPLTLNPPTSEKWSSHYASMHKSELAYIGSEHIQGLVSLFSRGELSYVIQEISGKIEGEVLKMIDIYTKMAPSLRMSAAQSKDELIGYFTFISDAYGEVVLPNLGSLLNSLRIIGNAVMMLYNIESILPGSNYGSIIAPVMDSIRSCLTNCHELFIQANGLDLVSVLTHRSFASLWTIIEYIYCLPRRIKINDQQTVQPLETFGDGVLIASHIFITLCDQESYYRFDSMLLRTLDLFRAEGGRISSGKELEKFIANAQFAVNAMQAAQLIASPYKLTKTVQ